MAVMAIGRARARAAGRHVHVDAATGLVPADVDRAVTALAAQLGGEGGALAGELGDGAHEGGTPWPPGPGDR